MAIAVSTALVGATGDSLFERLVSAAPGADGEAAEADELLSANGEETESLTLLVHGVELGDPELASAASALGDSLAKLDHVDFVNPLIVPTLPDGSRLPELAPVFSADDQGVLFTATIEGVDGEDPDAKLVDEVAAELLATADDLRAEFPDATVEVGGGSLLIDSIVKVSENDLARGEMVALPIALVVMLVVFGGFIAAGMPLAGAIAAIVGALGALFAFTYVMDIDTTIVNVVTAVGLGLSIDYGLLMVSRFREEYRAHGPLGRDHRLDAITRTADTAGRTVFYSGTTFGIASLGLLVFEPNIVRAIGVGALAVTVIAILSALTLIPALLSLAGDRLAKPGSLTRIPLIGKPIARFGDVAPDDGFFSRLTRQVQRQPALVTLACAAALIAVGSPLLNLQLANTSVDAIPASSTQHDFITTLADEFPDARAPRVALVTETESDAEAWAAGIESLAGVQSVTAPAQSGDGWRVNVQVDPADGIEVVHDIRSDRPDFPNWVTGTDARTVDFSESLIGSAGWAVLVIALGTILLLFLMTGSLIVPLKALVASALSLGASIGVLVWGFEQGNFAGPLNFDPDVVHGVDVLVLLLTLVFGFGLAMDYEMFILSRIKEQVDAGVDAREAIATGLQRSGRIISSAALIIVVVFAGFATGDLMVIKQLGVALAVAVTLDATVVRCLLVPAFMTWQQRIMWWAPRWMKRLHARWGLRES
ncbi:MMPL family transporter [Cryobacterium sp. BB736]|uniref:MMPL family transporter n=1 Tax=Cryobacterium sp. BB736 TaxID=2746963 RepID=UPI001875A812|nr:MMPL family transporter [Cryobacterium sp. BB736]